MFRLTEGIKLPSWAALCPDSGLGFLPGLDFKVTAGGGPGVTSNKQN